MTSNSARSQFDSSELRSENEAVTLLTPDYLGDYEWIGAKANGMSDHMASIAELVEEALAGRMFILVDDENLENEGDLVIPAQFATPEVVNFMARYARGLVCLAITRSRVEELGLPPMSQTDSSRRQTAFTVSIEAREGVTTGISAHDRAHTIAVAINPETQPSNIISPGHVFPVVARDGGTLIRAGHTEGAVDIARLAGLHPASVICEIMNEDGTMARLPDLVSFAQRHNLKLGSIADLIAYRRRTERLVARVEETMLRDVEGGDWRLIVYANTINYAEHMVLIKGNPCGPEPVLVRVHAVELVGDMLGGHHSFPLRNAMHTIAKEGRGVVVLIHDLRPTAISERVRLSEMDGAMPGSFLRDYGIGAQILVDLGVKDMILLSDTDRTIVGLEGYGLSVVEQRQIGGRGAR